MGDGEAVPPSASPLFLKGKSTFADVSSQKQLDEETTTSQLTLDGSDYPMLSILASIDSDILEDLFSPAENGCSTASSEISSAILGSFKWPLSCDIQPLEDTDYVKEDAAGPEKTEIISRKRIEHNVQGRFEETRVTKKTGVEVLPISVSNCANQEHEDLQDYTKRHACTHQSTDEGWNESFHMQNVENVEPGATVSIMQHGHSCIGTNGKVKKGEKESTSAEPEIAASRMTMRDAHCNGTNVTVNIKEKENIPPAAVETGSKSLPHIVECQPQGFCQPTLAAERCDVVDEDGWVCPRASKKRRHRVKQGFLDGWLRGSSPRS